MSKIDTMAPAQGFPGAAAAAATAPPPAEATAADAPPALLDIDLAERLLIVPHLQAAEMAMTLTQELTQEMMDFTTRRVRAQVALFDALSRCTDFTGIVETQLQFLSEAGTDCAEECSHLAKTAQARLAAAIVALPPKPAAA